jgi:RNA polymerase sigma factor (sigma-70 family)
LPTDNELMAGVRDGDLDRAAVLYERYNRILFAFFYKTTLDTQASEDLVHTVFVKIIKYRAGYKAKEGGFITWMFRIAHNANIDYFRARKHLRHQADLEEMDPKGDDDPDGDLIRQERSRLVREALGRLPGLQREVLILSRYQGLKYEEIARILKCRVGTVKARVFRAVANLRRAYRQLERG